MRVTGIDYGLRNSLGHSSVILRLLMASCAALCLWLPVQAFAAGTNNIYSHRKQILIQPLLDAVISATGIETKVVDASEGLALRLQAKGAASPADVISTVVIAQLTPKARMIVDRVGW